MTCPVILLRVYLLLPLMFLEGAIQDFIKAIVSYLFCVLIQFVNRMVRDLGRVLAELDKPFIVAELGLLRLFLNPDGCFLPVLLRLGQFGVIIQRVILDDQEERA